MRSSNTMADTASPLSGGGGMSHTRRMLHSLKPQALRHMQGKLHGAMRAAAGVLVFAMLGMTAPSAFAAEAERIDYLSADFAMERVLDWGDRPVWSPDGSKIAFTKSASEDSFAYELNLANGRVRCLTCRWGANGLVTRIYYLPDGSYLLLGRTDLSTATSPRGASGTALYWMPASAAMPPQSLNAGAAGEIAIDYKALTDGGFRVAWGAADGPIARLIVADLVHDQRSAVLTNRRVTYSYSYAEPPPPGNAPTTFPETYDFASDGAAVIFWTLEQGSLTSGMYRLGLNSGALTKLPTDGAHNEFHLFPDETFGLEESNRASDPDGSFRGVSSIPKPAFADLLKRMGRTNALELAEQHAGRSFDIYVRCLERNRTRRLTFVSDRGGQAHQSSPSRDGRRIVFALKAPTSGSLAGKSGLYVGTFNARRPRGG